MTRKEDDRLLIRGNVDLVLGADGLELAARWELSEGGGGRMGFIS